MFFLKVNLVVSFIWSLWLMWDTRAYTKMNIQNFLMMWAITFSALPVFLVLMFLITGTLGMPVVPYQ
jgi:hypothetical protein